MSVHFSLSPTLLTLVSQTTEEGNNVDSYGEILQSHNNTFNYPVQRLALSHQNAQRSRLGDYYEIHGRHGLIIVLCGELKILLEGRPFTIFPGQAFIHFPFQTHYFLHETNNTIVSVVTFEPTYLPQNWENLRDHIFELPEGWQERQTRLIEKWLAHDADSAQLYLYDQLQTASFALNKHNEQFNEPLINLWKKRLFEFLNSPSHLSLRVKELAHHLNLTPNYLTDAFKKTYGVPLGTYLEHRRFGYALKLLAEPKKSITDISLETGFLSTSAFSRKMKIWCGLTPSQCRAILLSQAPQIRFTPFGQMVTRNV